MHVWRPPEKKFTANQRKEHNLIKYNTGSIFIRLAVVAFQICEIPRNYPQIRTYSTSRSSRVIINLGVNRQSVNICYFLLVIIHPLTCKISCFLYSVNLILLTSPRSPHLANITITSPLCLRSHHLSLHRPFTPDSILNCFTNPFLHSLSCSIWTAFMDFGLGPDFLALVFVLVFQSYFCSWLRL